MRSLRRSHKGVSTIIAEVLMVLIVIMMSATIFFWVIPTFMGAQTTDTANLSYREHFQTITGSFATFVQSIPEDVAPSPGPVTPYTTCNGTISVATSANIYVPVNGVCKITANVGSVYVASGGNLTVTGPGVTINSNGQYSVASDNGLYVGLTNVNVVGWIYTAFVQNVVIVGSHLNTSGNTQWGGCIDLCNSALWDGGRGLFTMINNTVTGQIESEVSHYAIVTGNVISDRLEIESADFGQIQNNQIGGILDLDQNGVLAISGNTIQGNALYGTNGWCGTAYNTIRGSISGTCQGNVEVDVLNAGSIPVQLQSLYLGNVPLAGALSWSLASGNPVQCGNQLLTTCTSLPIIIPVGQMARVTLGWTPPSANSYALPWNYIYFTFVSRYQNFVDGYLYFTYGLGTQSVSRLTNRICPPCS